MPERRAATGRRRACAAVTLLLAVVLGLPGAAGASEVTAAQLHDLVQRALAEPSAVTQLRQVDRVDGRPVDLDRALSGASGVALEARLLALDPAGAGAAVGPVAAATGDPTDQARRILEDRRFHPGSVPRPFRGLFQTLGRWLRPISGPLGRAWAYVFDHAWTTFTIGALVVGLAIVVSIRVIRRRSVAGVLRSARDRRRGRRDDPDDLERRADEAERAGDLALAVRLRFRAGLIRLDRAGVVVDRPALTTGALTRQLPSDQLRELAMAFEEVAYGGRPASPDDVAAARIGWPRVLDEVAR